MKKILISIKKNSLFFSYINRDDITTKTMMNTNIINNNELVFSCDYIKNNLRLVSTFINEVYEENNCTNVYIDKMELVILVTQVLAKVDNISLFYIIEEVNFTYAAYECIIKYNNIEKVNCYSIPTFMIELFDQKNILVESRAEVFFMSNFVEENCLNQYSKIYYKMSLRFNSPIAQIDVDDFDTFCKINKYLKSVHFNKANIDDINKIIVILIKNKIKNIKICIHDNVANKNIVEELKKINKDNKKYNIVLKLSYSKDYIKNNYVKQVIISMLSYCAIGILLIVAGTSGYILYNNKQSENNVEKINEAISEVRNDVVEEPLVTDNSQNYIDSTINEDILPDEKVINTDLEPLLKLNDETVGWIKVPGTNIDYPIVRTKDNDFYLNHNFNKEEDYSGWVFMHYLNDINTLDKNTILFAHNRYYSGVMFGTLRNVLKSNWYKNTKDNIITFNTLYETGEWEVFSIYKIDVTVDYLKVVFKDDNDWLDFVKMIRDRSLFENDVEVGVNDKIVTLSTCLDNDQRLVVHAVRKK